MVRGWGGGVLVCESAGGRALGRTEQVGLGRRGRAGGRAGDGEGEPFGSVARRTAPIPFRLPQRRLSIATVYKSKEQWQWQLTWLRAWGCKEVSANLSKQRDEQARLLCLGFTPMVILRGKDILVRRRNTALDRTCIPSYDPV